MRNKALRKKPLAHLLPHRSQKRAPTFGAVPSAADLRKDQEQQAQVEEKKEEIIAKKLQPAALERLNKLEMLDPTKARNFLARLLLRCPYPSMVVPLAAQADRVKDELLRGQSKNGGIADAYVKELIEGMADQVFPNVTAPKLLLESTALHPLTTDSHRSCPHPRRVLRRRGVSSSTGGALATTPTVMWISKAYEMQTSV
jgi:hypothetical protein